MDTIDQKSELIARGTAFFKSIGSNNFAYILLRPPNNMKFKGDYILSDYPDEWVSRYIERNYRLYDPVTKTYGQSRLPFFWGGRTSVERLPKAERAILHEARAFHLMEGYAVPTAGPECDFGGLCMSVDAEGAAAELVAENTERIQLFAAQFHAAAIRILTGRDASKTLSLTAREREVLSWAAEGYSSEATAERLGLTAPTVNYHIANFCRKLGAANKVQAVALAVRQGLI